MASLWLLADLLAIMTVAHCASLEWWQTGVIYQIYPRSFKDSNGDGIGDLNGIREKLDYLKELGVTGVWLSPIFASPMADFGYDISDYRNIAKEFGTMEDFENLLNETHALGMKLVLDFVPNHSSDEHEWFVKASNPDDPEYSRYKDYYVWRNAKEDGLPPNNWRSIFGKGVDGDAWEWNEKVGQYYLHQFHVKQPDLNYRNPNVVEEMKDVFRFWLDKGVDGFRIDAIPHLFEDADWRDNSENSNEMVQNQQETYDMVKQWRALMDNYPDRVMMLEAYANTENTMKYFGTEEEPGGHFPFNFFLLTKLRADNIEPHLLEELIHKWLDNVPSYGWSNWVVGNHDNGRVATRLGVHYADTMNMLVMLLPGTAISYNGEEIGMTNNMDITYEEGKDPPGCIGGPQVFRTKSRDFERTPMQWDDNLQAGFSTAKSTWLPVNKNYVTVNVKAQRSDPKSHFNIYKKLVEARADPVIQNGNLETFVVNKDVFLFTRKLGHLAYVVVLNTDSSDVTVDISKKYNIPSDAVTVFVTTDKSSLQQGDIVKLDNLILDAYSSVVLTNVV